MERLQIIETLKHLPNDLEEETAWVSDEAMRERPGQGEYSIKEIIGHLRDTAEVWHKRLYAITSLTDPRWPNFDGEASVRDKAYQEANVETLIAEIREWRLKTVDVLSHAVDWTRLGQSPGSGRRSLKQWAEFVVSHDAEHIAAIRALKGGRAAQLPS